MAISIQLRMQLDSTTANYKTVKYQLVVDEVRKQIQRGELLPGSRLPSRAEMAARGINHTTLDRAHRALEEDGLIVRLHGRGTFVAELTQPDHSTRKGVIGFSGMKVMLASTSSYWMQLMSGIYDALQAHGMQLMLLESDAATVWDKVDGILLTPSSMGLPGDWHLNESRRCVSLLLPSAVHDISSVSADDYAGQRQATQHLLDLGHRSIALFQKADNKFFGSRRAAGYVDALQAAGIAPNRKWMRPLQGTPLVDFRETGRANMTAWLQDNWEETGCTAIMLQNDEAAIGAIEAFEAHGLKVPQDVSVMGFDDTGLCDYARPRLTSVEVPLFEIGRTATEMLLRQLDEKIVEVDHITLPTRVHVRESTAVPAGSLPL